MFEGRPTIIQGFELPFDGWLFLTILSIHVLFGLTAVIAGIVAMLSKKERGRHSRAGMIYYYCVWVVFTTASLMAIARWSEDYHLFVLGALCLISLIIARMAVRRKWHAWPLYHISGMGSSYLLLIIAFYVDNGRFLPIWKNFHPSIYWILPSLIGIPILIRALLKHPLSRPFFTP